MMPSMISNPVRSGHSAQVEISLIVNGSSHRVGQLGPDFLILDEAAEHPPTSADILMDIDGKKKQWTVFLPTGLKAGERRVRFE